MYSKTIRYYIFGVCICLWSSCRQPTTDSTSHEVLLAETATKTAKDSLIIDSNYSFDEATAGTKAPQSIINQLTIISVQYYSFDSLLHQGQIVCNKKIASELEEIFEFIKSQRFPVAKVIPIVKYQDDDNASMRDNNSYSFCYRDINFSLHAKGLAIDINPVQNPLRWKENFKHKKDLPENGTYNPLMPGTLYSGHPIVEKFQEMNFKWGHDFSRKYDDHHFEKKP